MSETPKDFSELSYFILDRLRDLSLKFDGIQRDLTAMQASLVSRSELKELREHCDQEFKAQGEKIVTLQIKAGVAVPVIAAIVAWAVRKLGG